MERKEVSSSAIRSVGHDPETNTLEVEMTNGKVYQYSNVSKEQHAELMAAKSIGTHWGKQIKPHHKCTVC